MTFSYYKALSLFCALGALTACEALQPTASLQQDERTAGTIKERPLSPKDKAAPPTLDLSTQQAQIMSSMQPAMGINLGGMFPQNDQLTPDDRFKRLETAVEAMRLELERFKPQVTQLASLNENVQTLIQHFDKGIEPAAGPVAEATPPAPTPTTIDRHINTARPVRTVAITPPSLKADSPVPTNTGVSISNLRIGQHEDFVRIVLDASDQTPYHISMAPDHSSLILELPESAWSASLEKQYSSVLPIVQSYSVKRTGADKGVVVTFQLKKQAEVKGKAFLPPGKDRATHRFYVDLKA